MYNVRTVHTEYLLYHLRCYTQRDIYQYPSIGNEFVRTHVDRTHKYLILYSRTRLVRIARAIFTHILLTSLTRSFGFFSSLIPFPPFPPLLLLFISHFLFLLSRSFYIRYLGKVPVSFSTMNSHCCCFVF